MAVPPSQRPRRVNVIPLTGPTPVSASLLENSGPDPLLTAILIAAFCFLLVLPSIAALLLHDTTAASPASTGVRIAATYCAMYGLWGWAFFVWACCRYSARLGRPWWYGLGGLFGGVSFLVIGLTGQFLGGLFAVLGLIGIIVPFTFGEDRLQRSIWKPRSTAMAGATWFAALGLFIGVSFAYGNSFFGGMTLDNKYIIEEYYKTLLRQDPTLQVASWKMIGYIFQNDYWWPKGISGLYRPLVTFSYWCNYVFQEDKNVPNSGLDPFQYHVVNLVLHWMAAFFGFLLIRLLTKRNLIAFCAALLFVTHPIATESVTNIIGRADVMAACATFAGTVMYIRSTQSDELFKWFWLAGVMLVTLLGIFAKESAVAIVGVMVVYDVIYRWTREDLVDALPSLLGFCVVGAIVSAIAVFFGEFGFLGLSEGVKPALGVMLAACLGGGIAIGAAWGAEWAPVALETWQRPWLKYFLPYAAIVPPFIAWIAVRSYVFVHASPPETPFLDNPIRGLGFFAARMTASDVFLRLLKLLALPIHLSCDYSFNQTPLFNGSPMSGETWLAVAGLCVMMALLLLAYFGYARMKTVSFLILFYLVVYLPTSNFLIVIGSIMAERFLYLPLLAFTACLVLAIDAALRKAPGEWRRIGTLGIVVVLAIACSARCIVRNKDWLTDLTLWASAIKVSPNSFRSYQSGAFALFEQLNEREASGYYKDHGGEDAHQAAIDKIIWTAAQAKPIVDVLPPKLNSSRLYLHLGMYYSKKGESLVKLVDGFPRPDDPALIYYRAAEQMLQQGVEVDRTFNNVNRQKEIERKLKPVNDIADVGLPPIYFYLGFDYGQLGELDKSLQSFQYMTHIDPTDPDGYGRAGVVQMRQNRFEPAVTSFFSTLVLNQNQPGVWQVLPTALSKLPPDGAQTVVQSQGRLQLNLGTQVGKSLMCLAYQNLVHTFLQSRRFDVAKQFALAAKKQFQFPDALFDDQFEHLDNDMPVPPPADPPLKDMPDIKPAE